MFLADHMFWHNLGQFRRTLQRIDNDRSVFIDKTAIYSVMVPRKTLVAPGQQPLVLVTQSSVYAKRYDFIGAITGSQSIACIKLSPANRNYRKIKGIR